MYVGVLGPVRVRVDDVEVLLGGQRLRDVLTVLLQRRGRPVPAAVILDLVWGDQAADLSVATVHTVVSRLRRRLGPDVVRSHEAGYLVDPDTGTDEDAFSADVQRARSLQDRTDPVGAAEAYRSALSRWRGPEAYAGVSDQLVDADRAQLDEARVAVTEELASTVLEHPKSGSLDEVVRLAAGLLETHPLRERPHQLAMLAAYRRHRQAEALAIYRDLRQRLRRELGIEPSPATAALHARLLSHDAALDAPPVGPRPLSRDQVVSLPAPISPLVARQSELSTTEHALSTGHRLVTLVGPGGVGKTRLLVEVGNRHEERRVRYVDLAGCGPLSPDELAEDLGLSCGLAMGGQAPVEDLIAGLADARWLLLVDEAEELIDPTVDMLRLLLDRCRGLQVLTTSRHPLAVVGEHLIPVSPPDCPHPDDAPEQVVESPAVRLLLARLADSAMPVERDADATRLLATIAREVDGLPLALELVAAQGSSRSLAELAELVRSPLDVTAVRPPRQPRHRSLRETIRWSTDRLDAHERAVLGRLSVFAGRFDLTAASAVIGTDHGPGDDTVRFLARVALLHLERHGSAQVSFRLLRTVRQLAEQDIDADDLAAARARHRLWFAGRWRGQPRRDELVEDVREHQDDYLEALRTALEDRDAATVADLVLTLSRFWLFARGRGPGLRWTTRVLDSGLLGDRERAQVRAQRAALALHHDRQIVLGDTAAAIPVLTANADLPALVTAHMIQSLELDAGGDHDDAIRAADAAVEVARALSAERRADAFGVQAVIHAAAGLATSAADAVEQGLTLVEATGSSVARIAVSSNLALALLDLDRPQEALDLLDGVAPDLPRVLGSIRPSFFSLNSGWAALGCGQLDRALTEFGEGVQDHAPPPADRSSAETVLGAACALALSERAGADVILAEALELAEQVGLAFSPGVGRLVERARRHLSPGRRVAVEESRTRAPAESADALAARLMRTIAATVASTG